MNAKNEFAFINLYKIYKFSSFVVICLGFQINYMNLSKKIKVKTVYTNVYTVPF